MNGFGEIVILECYLVGIRCYLTTWLQKGVAGGSKYLGDVNPGSICCSEISSVLASFLGDGFRVFAATRSRSDRWT